MSHKTSDDHYIFGYAQCGYYKERQYPFVLNSFSDEYEVTNDYINILGNEFPKKIYYPYLLEHSQYLESENIVLILDGIELLQRPKKFIDLIFELRKKYGYTKLFYLQGVSDPYILPVLIYLGINILDDLYIRKESMDKIKYGISGKHRVNYDTYEENMDFVNKMLSELSEAIRDQTLRDVVEKMSISSIGIELLRLSDTEYFNEIESCFPSRTPYIRANTMEALYRPDLIRYRNTISGYEKPIGRDIALLLPCSAKKPYSLSKTHQKILQKISTYRKYLHELIVTSPVGLVPRELENSYPARYYDIPVIGLWYEDEKKMMAELISNYFSKNKYKYIIGYFPEDLDFIKDVLPDNSIILEGRVTDSRNLEMLFEKLDKVIDKNMNTGSKINDYKSILSFQFGKWILKYISNDVKVVNNFHQDMLVLHGRILFVYNDKLGKFTITRESGKFFIEENKHVIQIDDFSPTSNVYAMGIQNATTDIRQYDEVVLVHNGDLRGVGIAMMPYLAMNHLNEGIAVKVRS